MGKAQRMAMILWLAGLSLTFAACRRDAGPDAGCLDCHRGLETASSTHTGCVSCHGGNPDEHTKDGAHRGIYGLADPSYAGRWEKGCGGCHLHQLERMRSSQMYNNAGMIAQIQTTWEGERDSVTFAARSAQLHDLAGAPLTHTSVIGLDNLSGDLYRKFCARCHVAKQNDALDGAGHAAGCAACHFPYADDAQYQGGDPTMRGRSPHSRTHEMAGLPPLEACTRCHQRSGRVALAYQGLNDGNNGLVPTKDGLPGPLPASDGRNYSHIMPDVHFAAGMECIDCHTSREVMGEGYASPGMHGQLEIRCEDCHGSGAERPRFATAWREHELPVREARQYGRRLPAGSRVALTSKGRTYSNVFLDDGRVGVLLKRSGRVLRSPVVTGSAAHTVVGHERLECHACHSRTVVQCYGCHTTYDKREYGWDFVAGRATRGAFSETEDVRALYPFPLAVTTNGRIGTVTPGCQTFINVVEEDGSLSRDEDVATFRGRKQLRFAPFFGHNTGTRAVGCAECHGNPAFLGFGQHLVERGQLRGTLLCEKDPRKPLDGFLHEDEDGISAHAAMSREGARPLGADEARRVFAVNLCVICHNQAADPIYRKPLEYPALDDSLHRHLLGVEPAQAIPVGGDAGPARSAEFAPAVFASGDAGAAGRALPSDLGCLSCHPGQGDVLAGPMATRAAEREFACRAFGREGESFFSAACAGCHVSQCRDCHEGELHTRAGRVVPPSIVTSPGSAPPARIADETCLRCHQGYFTGWEYHGRAPREDHERYQRGPDADGANYLKMLPDVHQEHGLGCVDCHRVHAGGGAGAVRTCRECHLEPSLDVPEHAIAAHLEKMECWSCHSAWAAQEYGTFLVRPLTAEQEDAFAALPEQGGWRRSAALRRQDPPPLGLNARGLVSPIRPQFVLFASDPARGWENRLLTAEWKAFFPHTVRRGTVTCGGCHDNLRRFVLEPAADRIYVLERDGLPLRSWWDGTGQRVVNGAFFTRERYDWMNRRTPKYVREHLRQWQDLLQPDASSSRP